MKVVIDMAAAAPVAPDYAMLKAALIAAQAGTPTAQRCRDTTEAVLPHAALEQLFAAAAAAAQPAAAAALEHRFAQAPLPDADDR